MVSTATTIIPRCVTAATRSSAISNPTLKSAASVALPTRRQALTMVVATGLAGWWGVAPVLAEDIPLFGIRKRLEKVEKEVEKEAEKVVEAAESEIRMAEQDLQMAEEDLQMAVQRGGRAADAWQAGAVVGAEVVGVVVATSIVNGILGPES